MVNLISTLGFIGPLGWTETIVIAVIGLLFFGKRLPEVGRSLGKGIVEFKKGLSGIESEVSKSPDPPRIENNEPTSTDTQSQKETT
ncbi:Sec-independent protein translocase subunit TatA/TatB [Mucisphaera sp.]|uniref:Sec-independent protein translocase subunit TatA/TatB n=1 Tax=Mucisphaera sp. TaxID=2913024 RepID=UPI003D0C8971